MTATKGWRLGASLFAALSLVPAAWAQAGPTATQRFSLSVFGGGSGVYTNVLGGRNLSLTAGADLTFRSFYGFKPSFELRGTYPLHSGMIAGEKSVLLGLKAEKHFGRLHPYGDFLVGRGQIDYQKGGFTSGAFIYTYSSSTVYSPGLGVDLDLTDHWALKGDYQYQMWTTYPLESKILKPSVFTGGVVYRFDFNHRYKAPRHPERVVERPPVTPPSPKVPSAEPVAPPSPDALAPEAAPPPPPQ